LKSVLAFLVGGALAIILQFSVAVFGQQPDRKFGAAPPPGGDVIISPTIIPPQNARDIYGPIADAYIPVAIVISNENATQAYLVHQIVFDEDPGQCAAAQVVYPHFDLLACEARYNTLFGLPTAFSPSPASEVLSVERARILRSGKARAFRAIDFSLAVGTGLTPLTIITPAEKALLAILSGNGVSALHALFPDTSAIKLQNLTNDAYNGSVIVPSGKAVGFVIFIPVDLLMSRDQFKVYKSGNAAAFEMIKQFQFYGAATVTGFLVTPTPAVTFKSGLRRL
jgi:hypothetical protein